MLDLLICIESRVYREGLCHLLKASNCFGRIRTASAMDGLADALDSGDADVILIDAGLCCDGENCGEIAEAAFAFAGGRPAVVLGLGDDDHEVLATLEAGAAGCVTRDQSVEDLIGVVLAAAKGELRCTPRITRKLQERLCRLAAIRDQVKMIGRLSRREQAVLGFLENCMSNKQIARELGLEVSTVKNHVHNILMKLGVSNRSEAAALLRTSRDRGGFGWAGWPAPPQLRPPTSRRFAWVNLPDQSST